MKTKEVEQKPHYLGHRARLRERFLKDNGQSMPDYELLELLLTMAIPRRDVKQKAKDLLNHFGSFNRVINATNQNLTEYGLSTNVIAVFKMVIAAANRMSWQDLKAINEPIYSNIDYVLEYCRLKSAHLGHEELRLLCLDAGYHIIDDVFLQTGTTTGVLVHPSSIVKAALNKESAMVVLVHNHPGGVASPSQADKFMTLKIMNILNSLGVILYDHIIITKDSFYSFAKNGILSSSKEQKQRF